MDNRPVAHSAAPMVQYRDNRWTPSILKKGLKAPSFLLHTPHLSPLPGPRDAGFSVGCACMSGVIGMQFSGQGRSM